MKIKYIISLSMVALTGASCWGAAENDKQRAMDINDERPAELIAQQEAPGAFWKMPREIFEFHILKHMPAAKLMEMAFEHPGLYKRIKTIPQFIQLQQNMERELVRHANNKQEVFIDAARFNYPGAIDVIDYLAPNVNINAHDANGNTALILVAFHHNNLEKAELLLAKGADIDARDARGSTALMSAAMTNNLKMAKLLLARGANINARDARGSTALMVAALNSNIEMTELLLAKGSNINMIDIDGDTALSLAKHSFKLAHFTNDIATQKRARAIIGLLTRGVNP